MSIQEPKGNGEVNPRRSSRRKMPRIEWDSSQETDNKTVIYAPVRPTRSKKGSNKGSFYGRSRSSVAGLRKLQRKGQLVKGSELLAKMTERRNKMSRSNNMKKNKQQREEQLDKRKEDNVSNSSNNNMRRSNGGHNECKPSGGFTLPLSIFSNIPDVGLCPLEEDSRRRRRQTRSSLEPANSSMEGVTKRFKLSESSKGSSDSDTNSIDSVGQTSSRRSREARAVKEKESLSPEIALMNQDIQSPRLSRNRLSTKVSTSTSLSTRKSSGREGVHSLILESWGQDCGRNSTKAPVLWALDNMADMMNEDVDWMKKAKAIWTKWKKLPPSTRTLYTNKAKANRRQISNNQSSTSVESNMRNTNKHVSNDTNEKRSVLDSLPWNHKLPYKAASDRTADDLSFSPLSTIHTSISGEQLSAITQNLMSQIESMSIPFPNMMPLPFQSPSVPHSGSNSSRTDKHDTKKVSVTANAASATTTVNESGGMPSLYGVPIPLVASLINNNIPFPLPVPQLSDKIENMIPLGVPSSVTLLPSSIPLTVPAGSKLKDSDVSFVSSSSNALKLQASVPFTIDKNTNLLKAHVTDPSSSAQTGIKIEKVENPFANEQHGSTRTPPNNVQQSVNSSFCISNILASTSTNGSLTNTTTTHSSLATASSTPTTAAAQQNKEPGKKKPKRVSPYRVASLSQSSPVSSRSSSLMPPAGTREGSGSTTSSVNNDKTTTAVSNQSNIAPLNLTNFAMTNTSTSMKLLISPVIVSNAVTDSVSSPDVSVGALQTSTVASSKPRPSFLPLQNIDSSSSTSSIVTMGLASSSSLTKHTSSHSTGRTDTNASSTTSSIGNNSTSISTSTSIITSTSISTSTSSVSNTTSSGTSTSTSINASTTGTSDSFANGTRSSSGSSSCDVSPSITVVTEEWRRSLEKQLRQNRLMKSENRSSSGKKPSIATVVGCSANEKRKQKQSNVLSRPPMKVPTPMVLNQMMCGYAISKEPQAHILPSPSASSRPMTPKSLPSSPITSPQYGMPPSPLVNNAFRSPSFNSLQTPIKPIGPVTGAGAMFMPLLQTGPSSPSAAGSTPNIPSLDAMNQLRASESDIKNKVCASRLSSVSSLKLTPEEQTRIDARNYADLERQYWRCLLAIEEQKRNIAVLKDRMIKARAEQQTVFLNDERYSQLKELIVNPVWEPVVPDLLDTVQSSSETSSEIRLKGTFDKPVLENEDVYKYLLQSLS